MSPWRSPRPSATAAGSPELFFAVHSIATDSRGDIYTTEIYEGKRVQKFVFQGVGPPAENQAAPWLRGDG